MDSIFGRSAMLSLFLVLVITLTGSISALISTSSVLYAQQQQEQCTFAFKWGSKGTGQAQFDRPHDVEFDSKGNIYISERENNNIQKFTHDGKYIMQWGTEGTGVGEFRIPYSILIDPSDNVYAVDKDNHRIQKFDATGNFIEEFDSVRGSTEDSFNKPEDMARDPTTGDIYVADTGNNRIVKFDKNFNFILEWGTEGKGPGEFNHPHSIGVDSLSNVCVNDLLSARIQKYDSNGKFLKQWGSEGTGNGQFTLPLEHLFVDPWDNVWMVDGEDNPRIQKFTSNGIFITSVGSGPCEIEEEVKTDKEKMSAPLPCDGKLHLPEHANMDSSGNLYVVDRGNQRIVVFSPLKK